MATVLLPSVFVVLNKEEIKERRKRSEKRKDEAHHFSVAVWRAKRTGVRDEKERDSPVE